MRALGLAAMLCLSSAWLSAEGWEVTQSKDPMTDKATVVMTQDALEGGAFLKVQCIGKDFGMFLKAEAPAHVVLEQRYGYPVHVKGKWRLDSAKAEGLTFGASTATDSLTPISAMHNRDGGKSFFKKMAGAQRVMFEVETVGGTGTKVYTFTMAGLDVKALGSCYP
jgi:hypothetical protein